jgi:hypothetical protein
MYLTTSRHSAPQAQYLMSHSIHTLVLDDITDNQQGDSRFDKLCDRSKQISLFLEDIKTRRFKNEGKLT